MADNTNTENKQDEKATEPTVTVDDLAKKIKELETQLAKQKKATDNASSDAADWKKKFYATQSEADQAEAKRKEAEEALRKENEALKRDKVIGAYSNRALALGYDADLAASTAEAMANGDMSAVFDGIGRLIETVKTKAVTDAYAKQPTLSTGAPPSTSTVTNDEENKYRKWMGLPPKRN
jgi:hypothetical protein